MYNEQNIKRLPQSKFEVVEILGYPKNDNNIPAATAEPITPATFGPMACINRKFPGFASCPRSVIRGLPSELQKLRQNRSTG